MLHKVVNDCEECGRQVLEVLVVFVFHGEIGEYIVVDKGRAQVGELTRRMHLLILVKMPRYDIIKDCVPQKLEPLKVKTFLNWKIDINIKIRPSHLVTICQRVVCVRGVGKRL